MEKEYNNKGCRLNLIHYSTYKRLGNVPIATLGLKGLIIFFEILLVVISIVSQIIANIGIIYS